MDFLTGLADEVRSQQQMEFDGMCRGWAVGTVAWKRALADEYSAMALEAGFEREELREIKERRWRAELHRMLREQMQPIEERDLHDQPLIWKISLATQLRSRVDAPYRRIADVLKIDHPASLRTQVRRHALQVSA